METIDKIEKAHYTANDHEVELLAAAHHACTEAGKRTDGAYLRILIASLQAKFTSTNRKRRLSTDELHRHAEHITETHGRLYHAVIRGVTTPEVVDDTTLTPDERRARAGIRNGRAAFARSAASTLHAFIKAGGDVRGLDVDTVTKTLLRTFVMGKSGPRPKMELIMTALHRVERQVNVLIADDPDQARAALEECMARLQRILDEMPHTDGGDRGTRVAVQDMLRRKVA